MKPRIAIIGGGIAGLSAAYELNRLGHQDFVLYEASDRLGGIVETVQPVGQDGRFVIECGPDSWVTEKPWAHELAVELGLEAEIIPSRDAHRRTYLLDGESLVPMPDGMRMMVPADLDAIGRSPLFSPAAERAYREEPERAEALKAFANDRGDALDESVASFVERHFGAEVTQKVAGPLLAGVFGGDIRQLSAAAVMGPFVRMEREHGSLVLALQEQKRRTTKNSSVFTTLQGGLQCLIDALSQAIPLATLHLAEPVLALEREDSAWQVSTSLETSSFDHIVLALPVHITRKLVAPWHPDLSALLEMESSSAVIAALAFDRTASSRIPVPQGFGFLVPQQFNGEDTAAEPELLAATFVDQKFAHRAPEGCRLLRVFFGGAAADRILSESDGFVLNLARRRLSRIFGQLPQPDLTVVRRWPRSLPQYTVGHLELVAQIEQMVGEIAGLHLLGNAFHGVGLPDLVRQGRAVAPFMLSL